jgi:hypothetical protein
MNFLFINLVNSSSESKVAENKILKNIGQPTELG